MSAPFASSGDVLIDRRFSYAQALMEECDWQAAAELLAEMTTLAPHWPPAWFSLGEARAFLNETANARAAFTRVLSLDPADALGAGAHLARLGDTGKNLSPAFVKTLFDQYADRFETHLVDALHYRGPELLLALLNDTVGTEKRFHKAVDLGCGTGLMGRALHGRINDLTGVDLAPRMVEKAAASGHYQHTSAADGVAYLQTQADSSCDLIIAADVLPYLGDLAPLIAEAKRVLRNTGLFLATTQTYGGDTFQMGADLRFHHSAPYLERMLTTAGFAKPQLEPCVKRMDAGHPVPSLAILAERLTG